MQSVFIINFNSLYEILSEIKDNLSFKIIKFENEENFQKSLDLDIVDYLVVSKTDYKLLQNNNITNQNLLKLKLTEKEIEIILYLNNKKIKHNVADLQKNIWGYSADMETHTVETHIYRLRKKISDLFKDENLILSHKSGYFIE